MHNLIEYQLLVITVVIIDNQTYCFFGSTGFRVRRIY